MRHIFETPETIVNYLLQEATDIIETETLQGKNMENNKYLTVLSEEESELVCGGNASCHGNGKGLGGSKNKGENGQRKGWECNSINSDLTVTINLDLDNESIQELFNSVLLISGLKST